MSSIDLTPIYSALDQTIVLVVGAVIVWIGMQARAWLTAHASFLDQATDQRLATGFERALQNGVNIAMQQLDQYEQAHAKVPVNSWVAAKAAQYAIDHSPDYMSRFNLTPDQIATKALAYLPPPPAITTDIAATAKVAPVTVETLAPAKS